MTCIETSWVRFTRTMLITLLGISLLFISVSCNRHTTKAQRQVEKEMKKQDKMADKEYKKIVKMHQKNQSKASWNMMKQSKKSARKHNRGLVRKK